MFASSLTDEDALMGPPFVPEEDDELVLSLNTRVNAAWICFFSSADDEAVEGRGNDGKDCWPLTLSEFAATTLIPKLSENSENTRESTTTTTTATPKVTTPPPFKIRGDTPEETRRREGHV